MRRTCDECPWRKDVPVGRFPPERFVQLRRTVEQGFGPFFACHKTHDGSDETCVGYLLVDGQNNFNVRLAASRGRIDFEKLEAAGPLYESYDEMARANGVRAKRKRGDRRVRA